MASSIPEPEAVSPLPWRVAYNDYLMTYDLLHANPDGKEWPQVASFLNEADARLVLSAVSEHDELRIIIREMLPIFTILTVARYGNLEHSRGLVARARAALEERT